MEKSRSFFNSKTMRISAMILALGMTSCEQKNNTTQPEPKSATEVGKLIADVLVGPLRDQTIPESELDHTCGSLINEGDYRSFRIPANQPPFEIDFELAVSQLPNGEMTVGNMPLTQPIYIGVVSPGLTENIALGYLIPIENSKQVFFAPFLESREYYLEECAPAT